jgi:hypothetical protein
MPPPSTMDTRVAPVSQSSPSSVHASCVCCGVLLMSGENNRQLNRCEGSTLLLVDLTSLLISGGQWTAPTLSTKIRCGHEPRERCHLPSALEHALMLIELLGRAVAELAPRAVDARQVGGGEHSADLRGELAQERIRVAVALPDVRPEPARALGVLVALRQHLGVRDRPGKRSTRHGSVGRETIASTCLPGGGCYQPLVQTIRALSG